MWPPAGEGREGADSFLTSGNRTVMVGGPQVHCQPPSSSQGNYPFLPSPSQGNYPSLSSLSHSIIVLFLPSVRVTRPALF